MYAAQEMFKTANKVTRPEKALILGFMAGSRGTGIILNYNSIFKNTRLVTVSCDKSGVFLRMISYIFFYH